MPILFMKGCLLSSKIFCLFIFSLFSNNILPTQYLYIVNVLCHARSFQRTISTRGGKSQSYSGFFTLNRNLFLLSFSFFVRAPVKDSVRSTYSFVHMLFIMLAEIDHCGNTISSGAGGPNTKRSLCPQAWTIGWRSWPVPERVFLLLAPGRCGGTSQ